MKRFRQFIKESWSELKKVSWPNRIQVRNLTILVFVVSFVVGLYLIARITAKETPPATPAAATPAETPAETPEGRARYRWEVGRADAQEAPEVQASLPAHYQSHGPAHRDDGQVG